MSGPVRKYLPYLLAIFAISIALTAYAMTHQNTTAPLSLSKPNEDGTYTMVLEEHGYVPKDLVIKKGSTVVFSTTRDTHHWPASNLHPNHEIYSEFDPKVPVPPDETWSFTFDRVGTWNLHDHLRSYYRGRIIVIE